ncbi:hypothetical protein [Actinomadura sp. SCN-SB]|uniref:hypothetical protein n=1 Tax=Actinomadura sp. SCN-SB TaxID=3373092 RepID=UPI00375147F8
MSALPGGRGQPTADQADLMSPFGDLPTSLLVEVPGADEAVDERPDTLQSPFAGSLSFTAEARGDVEVLSEVLDHLADEDFAEALEDLVDEAAARRLADQAAWPAPPSIAEAHAMLQEWLEPVASEAERVIDGLATTLAGADPLTMSDTELQALLDTAATPPHLGQEVFDEFIGGLLKKATKAVTGVVSLAKKGLKLVGKLSPINFVLGRLKGLVRPLLNKILGSAIAKLPEAVRPIATTVAGKLGLRVVKGAEPVSRLADDFDEEVAALLLAPDGTAVAESDEGEPPAAHAERLAELDAARARLGQRLVELPPGTAPVAEIEEFLPAVMALQPLVKMGIKLIGRDKVVNFIAKGIANLVSGMVGPEAAGRLSRPLVDIGLRTLGFEVTPAAARDLPGEALAQTVEGTVTRLLEMPVATFSDELQLGTALQQAFAESAAAFMPDRFLHADLPERETAGEGGVWLLMPRGARPDYRFRRYSQVFTVPITRQTARAIPWSDGGTLESYLLDRGAPSWPVLAEVDLYEAMDATRLGHLTEGEGAPDAAEFQPLTPETAGLLLKEPALGRRPAARANARRPRPGQRMFRVRPAGTGHQRRPRRPRHRVLVWLDSSASAPRLTVVLRLTERQAQEVLDRLQPSRQGAKTDLPGVLKILRGHYAKALPGVVAQRLKRVAVPADAPGAAGAAAADSAGAGAAPADAGGGADADAGGGEAADTGAGGGDSATIGEKVSAAVGAALSAFLTERAVTFAAAVRDPADGVSVRIAFPGVTRQSLSGALPAGQVTVRPGWPRRD